ncbi:MAG: hypothetical protein ACREDT_09455 [Methylocella sp.]
MASPLANRLAKSEPGNAERQGDLAASLGTHALAHRLSGDTTKAGDFLRRGQEIMARSTILSPDDAGWKEELAWFDSQIAELAER